MAVGAPLSTTRPSLHARVQRAFAVAVAAAIVASALGVIALDNLLEARSEVVDRYDPAALAAERMLGALVDQETAVRAYVLTQVDSFLAPYEEGRAAQSTSVNALAGLIADDIGALQLAAVMEAARRWSDQYAVPTIAAVAAGSAEPAAESAVAAGKVLFDQLRAAVDDLQRALATGRAEARADLGRATQFLVVVLLAVAMLMVAIVGGLYLLIRRQVEAPLAELGTDAGAVAAGSFDHVVHPSGLAELYDVGRAVEAMRRRIIDELAASQATAVELDRRASELTRSNTELEQFAYVASHDLQEPLRKVTAFTQLLQQRYGDQLDERADQYIEFAVDGARRMQTLINDLLTFSRVGRVETATAAVDAAELVDGALHNLDALILETGAQIVTGDLPAVVVAPTLGTAVFQNLIGNAIKFRTADHAPVVHISGRVDGGWAELTVADNGIGIEPAYVERVFVIFQRLHTKEAYPGTGIGLALCRKIVEQHGGRIWVDTDATGTAGTVIRFTLPTTDRQGPDQ